MNEEQSVFDLSGTTLPHVILYHPLTRDPQLHITWPSFPSVRIENVEIDIFVGDRKAMTLDRMSGFIRVADLGSIRVNEKITVHATKLTLKLFATPSPTAESPIPSFGEGINYII